MDSVDKEPLVVGVQLGMDMAIAMVRDGRLRLIPLPWEKEKKHPYTGSLHPWKITKLAWRSWWREKRHGSY